MAWYIELLWILGLTWIIAEMALGVVHVTSHYDKEKQEYITDKKGLYSVVFVLMVIIFAWVNH